MTRVLQFFSVAALTQIVLMLSQLVLLPIQIRQWGHGATAAWYSALAIAMITTVVDCGLRTAGHVEIVRFVNQRAGDLMARDYFQQVWGWIRLLLLVVSLVLIGGDAVFAIFVKGEPYPAWKAALILAYALETLLIIRIMYLDSLGFYRGAEMSYFVFAALRLALAVPALLVLRVGANGLAWLFLATSALALALQGRFLCHRIAALGILAAFPRRLAIQVLALARYTLAEPCANWVRLSLPVLVIGTIAAPAAVTTYVALRAAFGAGRTTIQQLARVASVEYLKFRENGRIQAAESLLSLFVLAAGFFGVLVAGFIVVDNMRILGLWLARFDRETFQVITVAFAPSAAFYAYQIILNLMFRVGELAWIARRHYAFILYSGLFATLATTTKWLSLYLVLLAVSEILLSATFLLPSSKAAVFRTEAGRRGLAAASAGAAVVLVLWLAARWDLGHVFAGASLSNAASSLLILLIGLGGFAAFNYLTNTSLFRAAPRMLRRSPEILPGQIC
jgi:hypothetical protein